MLNPRRLTLLAFVALAVPAAVLGACAPAASNSGSELCVDVSCSGHGLCVASGGAAACQCETGYAAAGLECVPSVGCDPNPCTTPHRTRCSIESHQIACLCDLGWHDDAGECVPDADNPCFPNPCLGTHKTQCALENDLPVCKCDPGYAADQNGDCTVTDVCSPNPCTAPHKTQCSDQGGTAKCGCDAGYIEDAGGNCVATDKCNPNPCTTLHKTVCTVVSGQAFCSCDQGWKSDGAGGCVQASACDPNPCTEPHKTVCSDLLGQAKCSCDSLYVDDGTGTCVLASDPTCTTAHPSGDQYENDDCAANAKNLPVGGTQSRTIDIAGDVDWMKATLQAGHIYHFACTGQDLVVYLYDTDATTQLAYKDDPETIDYAPTADGIYYFKVRHYYSTSTGAYSATLSDLGTDDYGNDAAHASPSTPLGTGVAGSIEYAGDNDWFAFDAVPGHLYSANTTGADTWVYFYDTDGTTILDDDDYPPIYMTATTAGPYYVRVRLYSSTSTGTYTLTITDLGVEVSGDSAATAGAITPGTSYGGMLSPAGDNDWYTFDAIVGHNYQVETQGTTDTYIYLYDTNGTTVLSETDYPPLYLAATSVGPYYVRVKHYSSTGTGPYSVLVTDLGPDDHGDDAAHATQLPVGATGLSGMIIPAGDNDWFKFDATANHAYKVNTTGIDTYVYIYDTDGTTILKQSDPVPVYMFAPVAGTYYVRVKHYSTTGTGQYTVTVEDAGSDDHGNDAVHATLANTSGTGIDGIINYPGDDDWFKFQATANHLFSINTTYRSPSTSFDSYVYVYDTDGTTILKESDPVPLVFGASVDGWYYVRVRHYSSTATGYYYTLTITDVGADDCGSSSATTCVIVPTAAPGTTVTGHIEVGGDDDWWAFDATAGHIYSCTTDNAIDTYVYLIDVDGTTAIKSQDAPLITFVAAQSGRYFYKVRAYSSLTTGTYTVTCTDNGPDDYPNGPVGAPLVPTDGTVQHGSIQYAGDVDWLSFTAQAGATYKIENPPVTTADTVVELYNPDGATLITSADEPPTITRTLATAGTYYVKVRLYSSSAVGDYTLKITKQ